MKHFGIYANTSDVQDALNAGTLENPYVATVQGNLDYNTLEQQSCAERGLCGDDPTDCHECTCEEQYTDPAAICDCEGGYYWGDECHDEPEPSDPCAEYGSQEECDCAQQGGTWIGDGHTEPCDCSNAPNPQECYCITAGGTWDGERCSYCDGDPECECAEQGGSWEGSECVMPSDDPCEDPNRQKECECVQQGGTWDGSECQMES